MALGFSKKMLHCGMSPCSIHFMKPGVIQQALLNDYGLDGWRATEKMFHHQMYYDV